MLRKVKFRLIFVLLLFFCLLFNAYAKEKEVNIYFIHSNTCSHCKKEERFLELVEKKYDNISIIKYEIHDSNNDDAIKEIESNYNIVIKSVPVLIINDTIYYGFNNNIGIKILKTIDYYSKDRDISLKKYIKSTNYNLIGNINTSGIDNNVIGVILGLLSVFGINNIVISVILVLFLLKKNSIKDRLLLLINYFLVVIVLSINNIIYYSFNIASIIIYLLVGLGIVIYLFKYLFRKDKKYLDYMIVMFLGIINECLCLLLFDKNMVILNSISRYELLLFGKLMIYFSYLMIYILFSVLLVLIMFGIVKKIHSMLKI